MTSWFFIEMAFKSVLICGIALLAAIAIRSRAAADRARVLRIGVALLLALPLIAVAFPSLQIEAFAAPAPLHFSAAELAAFDGGDSGMAAEPSIWDDPAPLILLLWAAGALAVLGRLAIGLLMLARWSRAATPAADPVWLAALERARLATGAPESLRLLVADKVPGPLGWGFRRPIILIDADTYAEHQEADAILAHEVAHVARADWPALMATRIATALFWFNPLVWMLAREAVQQAEEAADAHAAHVVEPTRYAETLLNWAQIGRGIAVPANSIAPARGLTRRVRAVLEPQLRERAAGSGAAVTAMLVCIGIAAPAASLEFVEAAPPEAATPPGPASATLAMVRAHPTPERAFNAPAPPAKISRTSAVARSGAPRKAPRARAVRTTPEAPPAPAHVELAEAAELDAVRIDLPQLPVVLASADHRIGLVKLSHPAERARLVRFSRLHFEPTLSFQNPRARDFKVKLDHVRHQPILVREQQRYGIAPSAHELDRGAASMERRAADMEVQARRLRGHDERERVIARERARGRVVTHQELLDAASGLEEGARGMRQGAIEMRRTARQMTTIH